MRANVKEFIQSPDLINNDLLTRLFFAIFCHSFIAECIGLEQTEIRMISLLKPITGQTFVTRQAIYRGRLAEEAGGKSARQLKLTQALLPNQ